MTEQENVTINYTWEWMRGEIALFIEGYYCGFILCLGTEAAPTYVGMVYGLPCLKVTSQVGDEQLEDAKRLLFWKAYERLTKGCKLPIPATHQEYMERIMGH